MMPPTSIDGTDITGATIDGTDVQEITVDGDTVFTAVPPGAFDITQFSLDTSISTRDSTTTGIRWSNDGTKMFEVGRGSEKIYEFTASTPFEITSLTFQTDINAQNNSTEDIEFGDDGNVLLEVSRSGASNGVNKIFSSNLSTPFDITTASFDTSISTQDNLPFSIRFNDDGTKLYECALADIYQSSLSTPYDISSASFDTSISSFVSPTSQRGIVFNNDGTTFYVAENENTEFFEGDMTTAFDIGSASKGDTLNQQGVATNIEFNDDGSRLYEVHTDTIFQYTL